MTSSMVQRTTATARGGTEFHATARTQITAKAKLMHDHQERYREQYVWHVRICGGYHTAMIGGDGSH
jgi:hypothetical protein